MKLVYVIVVILAISSCNQSNNSYTNQLNKLNSNQPNNTINNTTIIDTIYDAEYSQIGASTFIVQNIDFVTGVSRRNKDCLKVGDSFVSEAELIEVSIIYKDLNDALHQYINDKSIISNDFDKRHAEQTLEGIDKRIKISDYALLSSHFNMQFNDRIILRSLDYNNIGQNKYEDETLRNYNEELKDCQIVLFPMEHYREMLKKLLYIKYGSDSENQLSTWYSIVKWKYTLFKDAGYSAHIEELHRKMQVQ
jgi:hypothetical protein